MINKKNMTSEEEQKFKDFLFQAIQSGKKETSDLVTSILDKMDERISQSVEKTVNGKIKNISIKLDEQNVVMETHFSKVDTHIESDTQWKSMYTPYIKGLASLSDGSKILVYIIITIGAVGTALLAIKNWFK